MAKEVEYRKLKAVFIKDLGWKEVGRDFILRIDEHPMNSWVTISFSAPHRDENQIEWQINPSWIIAIVR